LTSERDTHRPNKIANGDHSGITAVADALSLRGAGAKKDDHCQQA